MSRPVRIAGAVGACTVASLIALAAPASAHVTIQPPTVTAGGYATLSFKVPNERDDTSTTGLTVQLPTDAPIPSVSVQPKPGWTYVVTRGEPASPVTAGGAAVSEVVTEISWTAEPGNEGIKAGEFDMFTISAGRLPEDKDELVFKAIQTYSDGEQVRWIEPTEDGQPEPELPAPVVQLAAGEGEGGHGGAAEPTDPESGNPPTTGTTTITTAAAETSSDDGTARALGVAGVVTGVAGLAAGGFALVAARRRPSA